jgi:LuxR family maltose regulon positive regulatory protein
MTPRADVLDAIRAHRLTLVLASAQPALRERLDAWDASSAGSRVWINLTSADNVPARFLTTLTAGLREICPNVRTIDRQQPLEAAIVELLNALLSLTEDAVVVLVNYDLIETQAIHEALARMLDYPPPHLHLVIVSRDVPPLPNLPRLRVRRHLWQVGRPAGEGGDGER